MISSDFFCNSPRPSCRISGASIVPPYPVGSIIPADVAETICHRSASPCVPSDRSGCTLRPACRSVSRADGRDDWVASPTGYNRNGISDTFRFLLRFPSRPPPCLIALSPRPSAASRLPPRPPCRGAGRRPFPRVCVDNVDCPIYIYNLPLACYSIGAKREQTKGPRND